MEETCLPMPHMASATSSKLPVPWLQKMCDTPPIHSSFKHRLQKDLSIGLIQDLQL